MLSSDLEEYFRMMTRITAILTLLAATSIVSAQAESTTTTITVGNGTGANIVPFEDNKTGLYQQIYNRGDFGSGSKKIEIREIGFSSTGGTGTLRINVILRLATARSLTNDFAFNMGADQ